MSEEADNLRRRAEKVLGWEEGASNQFSLTALREFVRTKSPKLHYLLGEAIRSGRHILGDPT
jgi:hypothetical protein